MPSIIFIICAIVFLKVWELSIILAPLGTTKGEFFLVLSVLSLNLMSFKIFRYIDFSPLSINCLYLLLALIFTSTSTYSLRKALLNTTDPISLPSITNPFFLFGVLVASLCWEFMKYLTKSSLAISEAALPICSFLRAWVFLKESFFIFFITFSILLISEVLIFFFASSCASRLYNMPESKCYNLYFLALYLEILSFPDPAGPSTVIIFFTKYFHLHY